MEEKYSFLFTFRGVIFHSISWSLIQKFKDIHLFQDSSKRNSLFKLEEEYSSGRSSTEEFFDQITLLFQNVINPSDIWSLVYQRAFLVEGVPAIISEIKNKYPIFGFSHFRSDILQKLLLKLRLDDVFKDENIIYSSDFGELAHGDSLINNLVYEKNIRPGRTIWIDADPKTVSRAVRNDFPAIIFIDDRRLRREIALRELLPLLGDE